jgi:peptidyl-prolyl cis-trans isomerase B (cyclophilin B)
MAVGANRGRWAVAQPALLWLGALLVGCGGQAPAPDSPELSKGPPVNAIAAPKANPPAAAQATFRDAIVEEPPDEQFLPEVTKAGKSVGKLYELITAPGGLWDQVAFTTPEGKKLTYTATLKTDLGAIQIQLWPDVAPNHVRNFVALARAGYYDGLEFDRTVREELADEKGKFECLEAGCPLGTGDPTYGSIGYWLKPELSDKVVHEEGTVGAWHGDEVETAACKFYITLSKAPWMDGSWTVFGKVTRGLEVARTILTRPVRDDEFKDRPVQPVVIRSVTIEAGMAESAGR